MVLQDPIASVSRTQAQQLYTKLDPRFFRKIASVVRYRFVVEVIS